MQNDLFVLPYLLTFAQELYTKYNEHLSTV